MPLVTRSSLIFKARKKNDPTLRPVKAGLNKQEKEIFDIYVRALNGVGNDLDDTSVLRAIQEAIEAGMPADASIALKWGDFAESLNTVVPNLANQVAASANISAKSLPKRITIESNFTDKDPRAIAWAQQRAGARIAGITKESQKAVAETIANGLKTAYTRQEVVARLRKIVGLDARQARALGNFYEKNLQQLLEEGYTYEEAVAEVTKLSEQYRQRLLTQRATRIARTETLAAANAGRMLSWAEADAQGLLPPDSVKRWKTATDERTCPVCKPLHNVSVPWQAGFSTGDAMPPAHPNCRCTAVIIPGTQSFEKSVNKNTNAWWLAKHLQGKHDQKTHGRGIAGIQEELASWSPLDPIPKSPKNAGSVPAKAWENWEHGPDGNQMFSLHRQYAGEELGLDVPKSPFDEGGYNHYLTQRGYGGSSLETSREHAKSMLSAIEEGKPQPALYRGIMENDSGEAIALAADLRNLEVGDSIDMPLVSTTRSLGVASLYATDYGDKTGGQPILIKIQEGGKGISQAPQRSYYASDYEVITSGKFEVVSTGVVKAPFWNRDRMNVENFGNRADVWGSDKMDSYRGSDGEMPLSIYETIHQGATTGNFGGLVSETVKFTDSRGGQKLSPNFKYGDRIIVDRWERQPEIEFKVIELKMIDTHKVKKAKRDFGIKFDIFFASRVSDITPLEPLEKHLQGKHDQKTHGTGSGGASVSFDQGKGLITMKDGTGKPLASVKFVDLGFQKLEIDTINSYDEGKGYGTQVLENLYSTYPEHSIFWGKTIVPASTILAEKFESKYGRTTYIPWGAGAINGKVMGQLYGQEEPLQKHAPGKHDQKTHGKGGGGVVIFDSKRRDILFKQRQDLYALQREIRDKYPNIGYITRNDVKDLSKEDQKKWRELEKQEEALDEEYFGLQAEYFDNTLQMKSGNSAYDSDMGFENESFMTIRDEYVVPDEKTLKTNASLRSTGRVTTKVQRFDSLVEQGEVKAPMRVYRGAVLSPEQVDTLQVGTSFVDRGFQSSGIDIGDAEFYVGERAVGIAGTKVIFEYDVQTGVNAVNVGYGEILIQRGAKVSITGIGKQGKYTIIKADVSKP